MEDYIYSQPEQDASVLEAWLLEIGDAYQRPRLYRIEVQKPMLGDVPHKVTLWADFAGDLRRGTGKGRTAEEAMAAAAFELERQWRKFARAYPLLAAMHAPRP